MTATIPAETTSSLRLMPHLDMLLRCANMGVVEGLSYTRRTGREGERNTQRASGDRMSGKMRDAADEAW